MTGLLHRPYSMNQASYDLSRLARNGLITRVPPRPHRSLTSRHGLQPTARPDSRHPARHPVPLPSVTLRTDVKDVAPKVP
jgi:hypothetical protein